MASLFNSTLPICDSRLGPRSFRAAEVEQTRKVMNRIDLKTKYHYEKVVGKRTSDGVIKLKKLRPVHKRIIAAYVKGMPAANIADGFQCSLSTVYRILGDPLSKSLIGELDVGLRAEFKAMLPLITDAIRSGLADEDNLPRMQAVDRWVKVARMMDERPEEGETTEKRVTVISQARVRLVAMLKDVAEKDSSIQTIEAEFTEVMEVTETLEARE